MGGGVYGIEVWSKVVRAHMVRFQNHGMGLKTRDVLENDIFSNLSLFPAQSVMSYDHYGARGGRIGHFPGNPNFEMP